MQMFGLELYSYPTDNEQAIVVLIRAPIDVLRNYADKINFKMLLDPGRPKSES